MTTVMDLSNALAGAVERAAGSVVAVHGRPRLPSTGVHWRAGLIVTANHTVELDREIELTGPDGRTRSAHVAGRDPSLDIAVLRAEIDGVPVAWSSRSARALAPVPASSAHWTFAPDGDRRPAKCWRSI